MMEGFKNMFRPKQGGEVPPDWTPESGEKVHEELLVSDKVELSRRDFLINGLAGVTGVTALTGVAAEYVFGDDKQSEGRKMAEDFSSAGMNEGMVHDAMQTAGYRLMTITDPNGNITKDWRKFK